VAAWIAEAEQQRNEAVASRPAAREVDAVDAMTADDIASLIAELGDIAAALEEATPEHKLDLYRSLRLKLTTPQKHKRCTPLLILANTVWIWFVSEGGRRPPRPACALKARVHVVHVIVLRCGPANVKPCGVHNFCSDLVLSSGVVPVRVRVIGWVVSHPSTSGWGRCQADVVSGPMRVLSA
jgi:hypothetical protein